MNQKATADWLRTDSPVLDYDNAMVPAASRARRRAESNWQEHIDGKPRQPADRALAPAKSPASLFSRLAAAVVPDRPRIAA